MIGNIDISASFFSFNQAVIHGAVYTSTAYLKAVGSTFISNYGATYCGALASDGTGIMVQSCVFFNNSASINGGAVGTGSAVTSINCTYTYNKCASGGAIYGQNVVSQNDVFLYNTATNGGGIYAANENIITNCTFSYNVANQRGGAVWAQGDLISNRFFC